MEEFFDLFQKEIVFAIVEFAFGVELFEFSGSLFGGGCTMFLEVDGFAAGAREGVNQAGEALRVAAQFVLEFAGAEMAKGPEELSDRHLKGGFVEFARIEIGEEIEAGFLVGAHVLQPFLVLGPALITRAGVPTRYVAGNHPFSGVA